MPRCGTQRPPGTRLLVVDRRLQRVGVLPQGNRNVEDVSCDVHVAATDQLARENLAVAVDEHLLAVHVDRSLPQPNGHLLFDDIELAVRKLENQRSVPYGDANRPKLLHSPDQIFVAARLVDIEACPLGDGDVNVGAAAVAPLRGERRPTSQTTNDVARRDRS